MTAKKAGCPFAHASAGMCGIAGLCAARGYGIEPDRLASMIGMLDHRGPDDRGVHIEPAAGLAHARLSVIDTVDPVG